MVARECQYLIDCYRGRRTRKVQPFCASPPPPLAPSRGTAGIQSQMAPQIDASTLRRRPAVCLPTVDEPPTPPPEVKTDKLAISRYV